VEAMPESAMPVEALVRITLDRPFVFMIFDTETRIPLFIGALTDPS
jgi:serine protease inhibitor